MGSKNKIIKDLHEVFKMHSFESALDLFSGSSSVSYLLKAMGKKYYQMTICLFPPIYQKL